MVTTMNDETLAADHAALIIDFLGGLTNGNWKECLDIAEVEFENTQSALWLAVCDGLRAHIRQRAVVQSERANRVPLGDDDLPF